MRFNNISYYDTYIQKDLSSNIKDIASDITKLYSLLEIINKKLDDNNNKLNILLELYNTNEYENITNDK